MRPFSPFLSTHIYVINVRYLTPQLPNLFLALLGKLIGGLPCRETPNTNDSD
jgi:hypothetical protein